MVTKIGIGWIAVALVVAASGCHGGSGSGATTLNVAFGPDDGSRGLVVFTLRCDPPGGSMPAPAVACARIMGRPRLVNPPPSGVTCSPGVGQWAVTIAGSDRGESVRQRFGPCDGQVFAWMRLARYRPCPANFAYFGNPCTHGPYAFGKAHMRGLFPSVPRVVGMTAAAARRILHEDGLQARFAPSFEASRRVIRQSPRPRASVRVYAFVTLTVAGP